MKKVEIVILGGFLGSGKSTLLKNFLEEEASRNRKIAVLMNEIGEYSVDSTAVKEDIPLLELLKGCICCSLKDEIEIQLLELYQEHQPDCIFVETTGVAHPIEVLDSCMSPIVAPFIQVKSIVVLVDGARWLKKKELNVKLEKLLVEQVKYADNILINKIDTLTEDDLRMVEKEIYSINPRAAIHFTKYANLPLSMLEDNKYEKSEAPQRLDAITHLHIQTLTFTFQGPMKKADFENWLRSIPASIYRIKGFIKFWEHPSQTIEFQYTFGGATYLPIAMNLPYTIVIIGNHLDKSKLAGELTKIENVKPF